MAKNIKKYIIIFLLSLTLCIVCAPLRALNLYYAAIFESIIYSFATFFLLKKYTKDLHGATSIVLCILLGRSIIELPIRLICFKETLVTLWVTSCVMLSIILIGIIYCKRKIYIIILSLAGWGYCVSIGHRNWINYICFGALPQIKALPHTVQTLENELTLDTIKSNYILLDFWNSSCGVCFQQFPRFQKLYNKYKDSALIRSVLVEYNDNENILDGVNLIKESGHDFPIWATHKNSSLIKDLNIKKYPTVIIINHDKQVIFKGSLNDAEKELCSIFSY